MSVRSVMSFMDCCVTRFDAIDVYNLEAKVNATCYPDTQSPFGIDIDAETNPAFHVQDALVNMDYVRV